MKPLKTKSNFFKKQPEERTHLCPKSWAADFSTEKNDGIQKQ